jgi:hypothetical protein
VGDHPPRRARGELALRRRGARRQSSPPAPPSRSGSPSADIQRSLETGL